MQIIDLWFFVIAVQGARLIYYMSDKFGRTKTMDFLRKVSGHPLTLATRLTEATARFHARPRDQLPICTASIRGINRWSRRGITGFWHSDWNEWRQRRFARLREQGPFVLTTTGYNLQVRAAWSSIHERQTGENGGSENIRLHSRCRLMFCSRSLWTPFKSNWASRCNTCSRRYGLLLGPIWEILITLSDILWRSNWWLWYVDIFLRSAVHFAQTSPYHPPRGSN